MDRRQGFDNSVFSLGFVLFLTVAVGGFLMLAGCGSRHHFMSRPFETKYDTIAHSILDIEAEHMLPSQAEQSYAALDRVIDLARYEIDEISKRGKTKRTVALETLSLIAFSLDVYGFKYKDRQLLSTGLLSKGINCDAYSALYLAIGEALDLPIDMVRAPVHTFVRWRLGNTEYINWETTIGAEKDDEYYIEQHSISKETVGIGALRSLNIEKDRSKILANAYVNSGVDWLEKCEPKLAVLKFLIAIKRDPDYDTPYYNIGLIYYQNGQIAQAIEWCEKALKKNPNHIKSHVILKEAYSLINRHDRSMQHFAKIMELEPEYYAKASINKQPTAVCREPLSILSFLKKL